MFLRPYRSPLVKSLLVLTALGLAGTCAHAELRGAAPITFSLHTGKLSVGTAKPPVLTPFSSNFHNGQGVFGPLVTDSLGGNNAQIVSGSALTLYGTTSSETPGALSSFGRNTASEDKRINMVEEAKSERIAFVAESSSSQSLLPVGNVTNPITNAVPEPSTWVLLVGGAVALGVTGHRFRAA